MRRFDLRIPAAVLLVAAPLVGGAIACGSADDEVAGTVRGDGGPTSGDAAVTSPNPYADGGFAVPLESSGIIIVHAASSGALRLCFGDSAERQPFPSDMLLPGSNVVGIAPGSAIRVPALPVTSGTIFAYNESTLRGLYPPGREGPTCKTLSDNDLGGQALDLGTLPPVPPSGVSVVVLRGCSSAQLDPTASPARCGADWTPQKGNLGVTVAPLQGFGRSGPGELPLQIMQLAPALESSAQGRALRLAFGSIADGGMGKTIFEGVLDAGVPTAPLPVYYQPDAAETLATTGFRVSLVANVGDAGDGGARDAGPESLLFTQSLADIGRLSSTRDLPTTYFGVASSYLLLLLGDPNAPATPPTDGGLEERRRLHFIAMPIAVSQPDADASAPR